MAKDPVCGMEVDENTAAAKIGYKGGTYYFCAPGCLRAFVKEPERYLSPPKKAKDSPVATVQPDRGHKHRD